MALKRIIDGAYLLALGNANCILLDDGTELTLVDAGFLNKADVVWKAVEELGRKRTDIRHLVFTHGHPDHIGSAAAILRETDATTYMHALDAPFAESGGPFRPMTPSPQFLLGLAYRFVWRPNKMMEPFKIDRHMADGDTLPVAGGLNVIGTPGHCAGQVAFLWKGRQLLIAGDVGTNILGIGDPVGFEDEAEGRRSQRKIGGLQFEAAAFGHGSLIHSGASDRVRRTWGSR
ncbi:MBL fold metallo-hydrolase [Methylobacterium sp. J-048]|uniref:MBL fold metallo-hydrolase n=1 Tax=Methylobacterium sp. J-048 TaxID=2836635 RepID=UPI001FB89D6D|nr:MBL fold metallo-hydrolase [Methylobacterium sp. J-048]MCJ2057163.1 MBL fold metallo-hydrolase [Methylobacterium sp. J-048]